MTFFTADVEQHCRTRFHVMVQSTYTVVAYFSLQIHYLTIIFSMVLQCNELLQWMKKYSINKLRLDLYKLVSGPDCKHVDQSVKALGKSVSAK